MARRPIPFGDEEGRPQGPSDVEHVVPKDLLRELDDQRVGSMRVLPVPPPSEEGDDVQCRADVFFRFGEREGVAFGDDAVQDHHRGDVYRDRGHEERERGERGELDLDRQDVVRGDDS